MMQPVYSYVVMRDDKPIAVMRSDCGRIFHSVVQVDAMEQGARSIPPFSHGAREYSIGPLRYALLIVPQAR